MEISENNGVLQPKLEFGEIFIWEEKRTKVEIQALGKRTFEKNSVLQFLKSRNYDVDEVNYSPAGQPFLKDYPALFISISHSDTFFAVSLTSKPSGIDIQVPFPKIERVYKLYVHSDELQLANSIDAKHLIWCVKEAAFKKHAGKFTNLQVDFIVRSIDEHNSEIRVQTPVGIELYAFLKSNHYYFVCSK